MKNLLVLTLLLSWVGVAAAGGDDGFDMPGAGVGDRQRAGSAQQASGKGQGPSPQSILERADQILQERFSENADLERLKRHAEKAKLKQQIATAIAECRQVGGCADETFVREVSLTEKAEEPRPSPEPDVPLGSGASGPPPMGMGMPGGFPGSMGGTPFPPSAFGGEDADAETLPTLVSVVGNEATFATDKGRITAKPGETLPGGYEVAAVSLKAAVIEKEDSQYRLGLDWPITKQQVQQAPNSTGLPQAEMPQ